MKTKNLLVIGLVAVAALTPALARVDFKPIAGTEFFYVADITSDGSKLLVYAAYDAHYIYTEATGLVNIGGAGCSGIPAMSRDGSVIASTVYDEFGICQAAKWLGGQDWLPMGSEPGAVPCGDSLSSVTTPTTRRPSASSGARRSAGPSAGPGISRPAPPARRSCRPLRIGPRGRSARTTPPARRRTCSRPRSPGRSRAGRPGRR